MNPLHPLQPPPLRDEVRETAARRRLLCESAALRPPSPPHVVEVAVVIAPPPGALRRDLFAQLSEINGWLADAPAGGNDTLTRDLRTWHTNFVGALRWRDVDEREVLDRYLAHLQELLVDHVTGAPLDLPVYLGSDGLTYGQMSIEIYDVVADEIGHRSLFDLDNPAPFTWCPQGSHVARMVGWLQRHGAYVDAPERRAAFEQLLAPLREAQAAAPAFAPEPVPMPAPTPAAPAAAAAAAALAPELQDELADFADMLGAFDARIDQIAQERLGALAQRVDDDAATLQGRVAAMRQRDDAQIAALRQLQEREAAAITALDARVQALEATAAETAGRLAAVQREDERLAARVQELQAAQAANRQRDADLARRMGDLELRERDRATELAELQRRGEELRQQEHTRNRAEE